MIKFNCNKKISENFEINANFEIQNGKFVCLHGKSGSGKTTILRLIAGFIKADSGEISVDDEIFQNNNKFLTPQKRNIGFLFQDYALFENLSVIKNLLFAKKDEALAREMLSLVELENHANARISELSGGQKQRVALARALMRKPKILLLDEPLSALDPQIRSKLQDFLIKVHKNFKITIILVSHDISEIYKLCEVVFEIENGRIVKSGSPSEIFLKTSGSQKFSFPARILEIRQNGAIFVAIVGFANQISEIVLSPAEADELQTNDNVIISSKAFGLHLKKVEI